jgi:hypothetical protein
LTFDNKHWDGSATHLENVMSDAVVFNSPGK